MFSPKMGNFPKIEYFFTFFINKLNNLDEKHVNC